MSRFTDSGRGIASIALTVAAAVLLALGTVAFYARTQVIDQRAFADRAADALADDDVRELVSREIVTGLIDNGTPDLVAARPLLETIVAAALQTEPFERLFRSAAVEANKTFFERDHESVALNLSDAVQVVRFVARSISPTRGPGAAAQPRAGPAAAAATRVRGRHAAGGRQGARAGDRAAAAGAALLRARDRRGSRAPHRRAALRRRDRARRASCWRRRC